MGTSMHRCMFMALFFLSGLVAFCATSSAQDSNKGKQIFRQRCAQCHTIEQGAGNRTGPGLYGVVACLSGTMSGFDYTDAMKNKGVTWTTQNLDAFIEKSKNYVPGTKMVFAGLKKPQERQNLIAYIVQFRNASALLNACGR